MVAVSDESSAVRRESWVVAKVEGETGMGIGCGGDIFVVVDVCALD